MYFLDHPPPHFHVVTRAGERIVVDIDSLAVLAGRADARAVAEALTWARANRGTLRRLWRQYSR